MTKPSLLTRETIDPPVPQNDESFQDNLLNVLLTPDLPWESSGRR